MKPNPYSYRCCSVRALINSVLCFALLTLLTLAAPLHAQVMYGVGGVLDANCGTTAATYNQIYSVSTTTGAASASLGTLSFPTVALGTNPVNGFQYYIEQGVANPRLAYWNPATSTNTIIGATTLPALILRMSFAPDGKLYVASNTNQIIEINPATGATIRTLTHNITTGGSGDFAFTENGDLYAVANDNVAGNPYQLWRITAAQIAAGGAVTATTVGPNLGIANTVAPNGVALIPPTGTCTVSPCFAISTAATNVTYLVDGTSGLATPLGGTGTTGACLTDLSRAYAATPTISKSDSRSTVQSGDTVVYAIVVGNSGPAGTPFFTVTDPAVSGLTCTTVTCPSTTGGGTCPTTLTVAALQGAGLVTGYMPLNSTITLNLTCTVN